MAEKKYVLNYETEIAGERTPQVRIFPASNDREARIEVARFIDESRLRAEQQVDDGLVPSESRTLYYPLTLKRGGRVLQDYEGVRSRHKA
ncbi:MAG: hypothetical protein Q8P57_01695 [Candidatus Pacearchaeota archaeon]|nr:hypothetical protein [Candidatus Pacearchaeota archaeon]